MRTLLFDLTATQPNASGEFHGGGKYAKVIFHEVLLNRKLNEWSLLCIYDAQKRLDDDIRQLIIEKQIPLLDLSSTPIEQLIEQNKVDRVYSALPSPQLSHASRNTQFYSTIHGLRFLELDTPFEALKYTSGLKSYLLELANILLRKQKSKKYRSYYRTLLGSTATVVVSNHTKFSALTYFPEVQENTMKVFYSPDVSVREITPMNDVITDKKYFLLVSGNRWIKNNIRSAIALDKLISNSIDPDFQVVITGVNDPQIYLRYISNKNHFLFRKYVDENTLAHLYKNAFALVYMSLNEGFGYPPLEAMCHGTPVITSPLTSITEICGDAVLYANPFSVSEIATRINYLLHSPFVRQELSTKGSERFHLIQERQNEDLKKISDFIFE